MAHKPVKGSDPRERYNTNGQDGQRRSFRRSSSLLPFSFMAEEWIHPEKKIERGIFAEISLSLSSGIECQLEESGVN